MPRIGLVIFMAGVVGACGSDSAPTTNADVEEVPIAAPAEDVPADSIGFPTREGLEPGLPGSHLPVDVWSLDSGDCYAYENFVVYLPGRSGVIIVRRGTDRSDCGPGDGDERYATAAGAEPESFFGLVGEHLLIEAITDDGPSLRVFDLMSGEVLHEALYEEPVEIRDGGLFYGGAPDFFDRQEALDAAGRNCPQSREWFDQGLVVGVSLHFRFDLDAHEETGTGTFTCIPLG